MVKPEQLRAKDFRRIAILPIRAVKDPRMTGRTLQVLAAFCSYCDHLGRTFVSLQRVGEDVGMERTTVCHHVRKLYKLGYMVNANRFYKHQKSTSRRVIYDPSVKEESTLRSRLTAKEQMILGEAEAQLKESSLGVKMNTNTQAEQVRLELKERFEKLCVEFFTTAIAEGYNIKPEQQERAAMMLASQAVDLIKLDQELRNHAA